jgi:carbonic anhydrase/acetyltransferase-like protein (isoleucine patch superfamily)
VSAAIRSDGMRSEGIPTGGLRGGMRSIGDYFIAENAVVTGDVVFGPGANVWFNVVMRGDLSRITLGPRVNLQDGVIVHTDFDAPQTMEEGVVVGHAAILHGVRIGRDSLIGMGAMLLSGTDIGVECLVAAGTIVTEGKKIPPRSVVMGVPGKVVRQMTDEDVRRIRENCDHYVDMARRYARGEFPLR